MIQSLEKALLLLNAIAAHGDWIGVREVSRATGLKPPTAQQLLKTLQAFNYLEFDSSSRRYRIGIAALRLGAGADQAQRLKELVKPAIDSLFLETGETTAALYFDRESCCCVYGVHCEKALATSMPSVSDIKNPHVMAGGQVLLAWQDASFVDAYRKRCVVGPSFLADLEKVRKAGYAELINFNDSAVAAYGVPVFDSAGRILLSLGWSIPLVRFDSALRGKIVTRLLESAKLVESSLSPAVRSAGAETE